MTLKERYDDLYKEYALRFVTKHDLQVEGSVCDIPLYASDYFISYEEMRYDIDNDIEVGVWEEYYDKMLQYYMHDLKTCNYESWCKGLRLYTDEQYEHIIKTKALLEKQKEELMNLIKKYDEENSSNQ